MAKKQKKSNIFVIVLLIIIVILVLFFPKIYGYIESLSLPKVEGVDTKNEETTKTIDDDLLSSLHYPIMRDSIYSKNTYYSLDTFTLKDMSNEDILYNAFIDMYEGNIIDSNVKGSCTNIYKEFNSDYIELRIKNILGKNLKYTLSNFTVPQDSNSNYKGMWTYDSSHNRFIYNGSCDNTNYKEQYYNLEEYIKAEYDKNDVIVYKYVGFAKVENGNYVIYKDAGMAKELKKGTFTSVDDLNNIFKSINKKDKKVYRYTFKNTLCSYNEYCLYEGKWVNGI